MSVMKIYPGDILSMRRVLWSVLDRWPTPCPLCRLPAKGGDLCPGCLSDTFLSRQRRNICCKCGCDLNQYDLDCSAVFDGALQCRHCTDPQSSQKRLLCALDDTCPADLLLYDYTNGCALSLANVLGRLMAQAVAIHWPKAAVDWWVPIPETDAEITKIGFSPAQQLARVVASQTAIAYRLDLIRSQLSAKGTLHRVEAKNAIAGLRIGLVTVSVGAQSPLFPLAELLRDAGALEVWALAAAKSS
jgi:predicted amidophosphoribosyltransferase